MQQQVKTEFGKLNMPSPGIRRELPLLINNDNSIGFNDIQWRRF